MDVVSHSLGDFPQLLCREVYELTAVIALVREVEGANSPTGSAPKEAADEGHLLAHIKASHALLMLHLILAAFFPGPDPCSCACANLMSSLSR